MTAKVTKLFLNWLVVVLWLAVIFYFSNQPNLKSEFQPFWDLVLRKGAHMAEYFVLTFLLFRALNQCKLSLRNLFIVSALCSLAYAISDEFHQSFVGGRVASPIDVSIDSFGIIGFVVLKLLEKREYFFCYFSTRDYVLSYSLYLPDYIQLFF